DRFNDSETVQNALRGLSLASDKVIANGNDPSLAELAGDNILFFGLSKILAEDESAPRYSVSESAAVEKLDFEIKESSPFVFITKNANIELTLADIGMHMLLNFGAALATALQVVTHIDFHKLEQTAENLEGVYGRDTLETINGVPSRILLVQNHESFRLNILRAENAEQLFMAIGTDVKDPSWLWGVDMSSLPKVDKLTGHHAIPMKYRLLSCDVDVAEVMDDFDSCLHKFIDMDKPKTGERVFIVTADTFRRMKRSLELSS
ncbi:MAG TPA: hypothetical protein VIB61_03220, partial [Microbacteriaceae bacterium]